MIFANLICRMQHGMFASFTVIMSPTSLQMHAGSWRWGWSDRKDIFPGPVLYYFMNICSLCILSVMILIRWR